MRMIRTSFFLPRPRHPLARLAFVAFGAIAIACALVLGAFVFAAIVLIGAAWMLWRSLRAAFTGATPAAASAAAAAAPRADTGVIDGQFTVLKPPTQRGQAH